MNQVCMPPSQRAGLNNIINNQNDYVDQLRNAKDMISRDDVPAAIEILKSCLKYSSDENVLFSLAQLCESSGKKWEAIEYYRDLSSINPVKYGYSLAKMYVSAGRFEDFYAFAGNVPGAKDDSGYNNLYSIAALDKDDFEMAFEYVEKAIELNSKNAAAYVNKGNIFRITGEFEKALVCYQRAEELGHQTMNFYNNVGVNYEGLDEPTLALNYYLKAMQMQGPIEEKVKVASNTAYAAMSLGMFDKAWEMYKLRKLVSGTVEEKFPAWKGESLHGKTILFRREQGLGDEFRFVGGIAEIASESKAVILQCDPRLVDLFQRSMPDNVKVIPSVGAENKLVNVDVDFAAHIGDIGVYKRGCLEDFPSHKGYLISDSEKSAYWRSYFDGLSDKVKVGISWRSGNLKGYRNSRYADIMAWAPLFELKGIQFVNLFYGDASEELAWVKQHLGVEIHTPSGIDLKHDQDELAALISQLDLVIGPNTAPIDLGMALVNVPVWITTFAPETKRCSHYFGENYFPWAPHAKPIWAESFEATLAVAARELAYVLSTENPKETINLMYDVPEVCFKQ